MHVVTASRLEPLAEYLVSRVTADPLPPLEREVVMIAQNTGLRDWVEAYLARRIGCAASLHLVSPRRLAAELTRLLVPPPPVLDAHGQPVLRDPFEREGLQWRLAALLPQLPRTAPYTALHAYCDAAGTDGPRLLAARLAHLFDDYQVYRPDVLAAWARGEPHPEDHEHAAWQAALWQQLVSEIDAPDRAAHIERLIDKLEQASAPPLGCPRRVTVFGALIFPPLYLRLFRAMARHADVCFLAVLPPTEAPFENELLAALGERSRELAQGLYALPQAGGRERLADALPQPRTALEILQADVLTDTARTDRVALDPSDRSVQVHDVHSPLRELEVLRDGLLDAFETLPGLRPDDVLVILPDLATYAPVVDAVLGAEHEGLRLPYHVVDHPHAPARRVLDAVVRLLALPETRCTAADLVELLHEPVFGRAAGLRPEGLDALRAWAARARVHWGRDGRHKAAFGLPEDDVHTWQHGIDRLMLGYAVGDDALLVGGQAPLAGVHDEDVLGRFAEWTASLFAHADAWDHARPLAAWARLLLTALDELAAPQDDEEQEAMHFVRERVAELEHLHHLAAGRAAVPFAEVRAALAEAAARYEPEDRTLTGRITVAAPMVLGHAPFRVVAFLGLNDGTFPRPHDEDPLDLIAARPRPGDARPRQTERQLFLDALLATRDRLLLSFVGRSERDNSPRAASPVLEVFLRTCDATFEAPDGRPASEHLTVRHRLQPFSPAYFRAGSPLFTYAGHQRLAPALGGPSAPPPFCDEPIPEAAPVEAVPAEDLVEAWAHPSRYFCRRRLGLRLEGPEEPLADDEPLHPDGLAAFHLKEQILAGLRRGLDDEAIAERLRAAGALPPGALGTAWFEHLRAELQPLADRLSAHPGGTPRELEIRVGATTLTARLPHVTDDVNLLLRCAGVKDRARPLLEAWILHLTLALADGNAGRTTLLVGTDRAYRFDPVLNPQSHLEPLLRGWRRIRETPPPLFQHASLAFAREAAVGQLDGHAMSKARQAFDNAWAGSDDARDPYVQLCFRSRDPLADKQFGPWARGLWSPILHYCREA